MIHHLPEIDWEVEIYHIYREANGCADALANDGGDRGIHWSLHENCHFSFDSMVNFSIVFHS